MGGPNVVGTAMMMCSFGMAPASLNVLPVAKVMIENKPAATIILPDRIHPLLRFLPTS